MITPLYSATFCTIHRSIIFYSFEGFISIPFPGPGGRHLLMPGRLSPAIARFWFFYFFKLWFTNLLIL
jgi:hypothetical protein